MLPDPCARLRMPRRTLLHAAVALAAAPAWSRVARAAPAFSFDALTDQARTLAQRPHVPAPRPGGAAVSALDYDAYQKIRFRPEHALFAERFADSACTVQPFHPGRYFEQPVGIYTIEHGKAREIPFTRALFDYADPAVRAGLTDDLGFAGLRLMNPGGATDWMAFLGASYFRSAGPDGQYGQSARAVAVDTASAAEEDFPRFTRLYVENTDPAGCVFTVYALLDGESLTGAVRLVCRRADPVTQEVSVRLFLRRDVQRLGIAPLTSMYWYGERDRPRDADWRPEIHDTDGLALWTADGERLWRPLTNPGAVRVSAFAADRVRGFGLLQRDRDFDHYQDDGAWYDRRPGAWIEPLGDWGAGAVELVEIPTRNETHDNIVAFWRPQQAARAGDSLALDYRLHWVREEPWPPGTARVMHTFAGRTGVHGQGPHDRPGRKYVIDFAGPAVAALEQRYDVQAVVSASAGVVENPYALRVVGTDRWRGVFDLHTDGPQPVELRCFLRLGERTLTETWVYTHLPQDAA